MHPDETQVNSTTPGFNTFPEFLLQKTADRNVRGMIY